MVSSLRFSYAAFVETLMPGFPIMNTAPGIGGRGVNFSLDSLCKSSASHHTVRYVCSYLDSPFISLLAEPQTEQTVYAHKGCCCIRAFLQPFLLLREWILVSFMEKALFHMNIHKDLCSLKQDFSHQTEQGQVGAKGNPSAPVFS